MRIIVNNIAANSSGALSILTDFHNYLVESNDNNEWIFLLSDNFFKESKNIKILTFPKVKKSRLNKLAFDYIYGAKIIKRLKPDIVFSMQNIITFRLKVPQIVYLHQAIPFQNYINFNLLKKSERHLAIYQHLISKVIFASLKKSSKVIVQTNSMKNSVLNKIHIPSSKVFVINPQVKIDPVESKDNSDPNIVSFFYPAINEVYKNHKVILDACQILLTKNTTDFKIYLTIDGEDTENIKYLGKISREEVFKKYTQSTLIFPSLIESFPLPLIEAAVYGSLILAGNTSFSQEILRDYRNAYFFSPLIPTELSSLMEKVINKEIQNQKVLFNQNTTGWKEVVALIVSTCDKSS